MKKNKNIFGERLRKLREAKGISQLELARIFHMDKQRISKYELGQRQADDQIKIAFADFFNVTIDYLLGRTDNPNQNPQSSISDEDIKKIKKMKNLPPDKQKALDIVIDLLKNEEAATEKSN